MLGNVEVSTRFMSLTKNDEVDCNLREVYGVCVKCNVDVRSVCGEGQ